MLFFGGFIHSQNQNCSIDIDKNLQVLEKHFEILETDVNIKDILLIHNSHNLGLIIWKEKGKIMGAKHFISSSCIRKRKKIKLNKKQKENYSDAIKNMKLINNLPDFECIEDVHTINVLTIITSSGIKKIIKTNCANEYQKNMISSIQDLHYCLYL